MLSAWSSMDASRRLIAISAIGLALLLCWAAFAEVDSITRGQGRVIPSSRAQLVQPSGPAVISEILVRNGQMVEEGQLLVRLDDSQSASELGQLQTENERLSVRAQRLSGEADGRSLGCEEGSVCAEERRLQQARAAAARSRENALAAAIEQRRRDLREAEATVASLRESVRLASEEVAMLEPLAGQGIVPRTELLAAQREVTDLRGRLSAAQQAAGRASAAIRQAQADLSSARLDFRQQALNERSEVATRIAVNEQTIRGAEARLERNEIKAPASGVVNNVQVTTEGGFVNAGEAIMQIVPIGEKLLIEARVDPSDIAFIAVGDPAIVKVTAYDFSIYGGLDGVVTQVSADSIYDEVDRVAYYSVIIETEASAFERGGQSLPIVPGMICEVEVLTGRRTILSYLLKPVARAFDRAMTER